LRSSASSLYSAGLRKAGTYDIVRKLRPSTQVGYAESPNPAEKPHFSKPAHHQRTTPAADLQLHTLLDTLSAAWPRLTPKDRAVIASTIAAVTDGP
jgi:hypothetical protein